MSIDEEQGTAVAGDPERRDRRAERRETQIMAFQVVIAALAAVSLILWAFGWPLAGAAWAALAGVQAVAMIYAQRMIRLWRRHARETRQYLDKAYDLIDLLRR